MVNYEDCKNWVENDKLLYYVVAYLEQIEDN